MKFNQNLKRGFACLFSVLLLAQLSTAQVDASFASASTNIAGDEFPKISDDLRVWLQIKAPSAGRVQLAGALLPGDPVDMEKDAEGNWKPRYAACCAGLSLLLVSG